MKKRHASFFWLSLALFSLMGQVAWVVENMYFNVFIYKMFHASAGQISAMVSASAVAATLTTIFMGALSDKVGKRKIFISLGYMLWGISIFSFILIREETLAALFPLAGGAGLGITLTIVLDCVMTFFGSTANDAAFNAWLTDSSTKKNRGAAEGINAMMPLVAILVVFGSFMFFDLDKAESWSTIFAIIGTLVFFIGILGFFLIREPKIQPSRDKFLPTILYGFTPRAIRQNPTLYLHLAGFILFNIAIQIFMPYLIIYYEVTLGMANYVLIMAPAILLASLFTALWGRVYDKRGFRFSGLLSLTLLASGFVILYFSRTTLPVFIGSLLMMCGYLAGMAVFGASIREHTPQGSAGRLQGVRIFSQVLIPGVIGPMIGKTILSGAETLVGGDGTESFIPSADIFLGALIVSLLVFPFFFGKKKRKTIPLHTPYEKSVGKIPFDEYPRPGLKRDSYLSLNGPWKVAIENKKGRQSLGTIRVPFPPESPLSGIGKDIGKEDTLIYRRTFTLPEGFLRSRTLLHFGAVDQEARVFLNGKEVGQNTGGYLPFSFDITPYLLPGENTLTVRVKDAMDTTLPWGKQTAKPGGMWYTKVSGIWQSVWLESIPESAIESLRFETNEESATIFIQGGEEKKTLILQEENRAEEIRFSGDRITITPRSPRPWSPEDPFLYRFTLISGEDRVESYFALRRISIEKRNGRSLLCLNGKPYHFHGLLDQGYWPDGIFLPGSPEGFREDILKMKECGFNMLRKHIKVEPELFYYECDRLGMAVFQDMVNAGPYSFLFDTALPTLGIKKGISHSLPEKTKEAFLTTSRGIIRLLQNHPSVLYYTIFNEGWGQFEADRVYREFKDLDPSRIFDTTSGWFREKASDVVSEHVYFKPIKLKNDGQRPLVLSEFGGYSYKVPHHAFSPDKTYAYRFFRDQKSFEEALIALYEKEVIPTLSQGLSATVLTQVSDVEEETNGLITYDRQVLKVHPERMRDLADRIQTHFHSLFS